MDSVKYNRQNECLYAIRVKSGSKPEKIIYLKSNSDTNYLGIIRTDEYIESDYNPKSVFSNVHVFMKPVDEESFLILAHKYVLDKGDTSKEDKYVRAHSETAENQEEKPVAYVQIEPVRPVIRGMFDKKVKTVESQDKHVQTVSYTSLQKESSAVNLKGYVEEVSAVLNANWMPPKSGRNTQAIVILTIGPDGSLQKYKMAKSSGDEATDRSIINAAEQAVPYAKFPKVYNQSVPLKLQFVFTYKKFRKSVI